MSRCRLRKNYCGIGIIQRIARLGQQENTEQDAEKAALLTHPTPARRDAPFPMRRSRFAQRLNVPKRAPSTSSLAAALLGSLFEHPARCSPVVLDVRFVE